MEDTVPYGFELPADGKTLVEAPDEQEMIALIQTYRQEGLSLGHMAEILEKVMVPHTIKTAGRTDCADYFEQSGLSSYKDLAHTPILVFLPQDERIEVRIVRYPPALLAMDDAVKCMGQWRGKYRSDWFQFTVGQFRDHLTQHPTQALVAKDVATALAQYSGGMAETVVPVEEFRTTYLGIAPESDYALPDVPPDDEDL